MRCPLGVSYWLLFLEENPAIIRQKMVLEHFPYYSVEITTKSVFFGAFPLQFTISGIKTTQLGFS